MASIIANTPVHARTRWGLLLLLWAAVSVSAMTSEAHAQSAEVHARAREGICAPSALSPRQPGYRAQIGAPSWFACRVAEHVRQLLLHDAIAGSRTRLQRGLTRSLFATAYKAVGARLRWSALERSGGAMGVSGLGFSLGRASWTISKVSFSSVLLSLRLSV